MTETILACGGRRHLCGWQVEVNHAIKAIGLSFSSDAVLTLPTVTSEVRLFEVDNGTMTRAPGQGDLGLRALRRPPRVGRRPGHRRPHRTYDFWARHRHTRSRLFPALHVVLAGLPEHHLQRRLDALARGVEGITIAVLATTLPRLKRGESW
ncbi:replication-relaxation family protein [Streptomyces rimosus]